MQASSTFKRAFLHLMLKGLKQNVVHSKSMSIQERKKVIKLSADAAMAIARGRTKWSSALIAGLEKKTDYKRKIDTSKRILRRRRRNYNKNVAAASEVARRMMKKRAQLLKKIIPGCESLNRLSFLSQTVDYVIHLQAQVNLMQCLAKSLGISTLKHKKKKVGTDLTHEHDMDESNLVSSLYDTTKIYEISDGLRDGQAFVRNGFV